MRHKVEVIMTPSIGRSQCTITVNSVGAPEKENWYTIWKYAVAIYRLCVDGGRSGFAKGLGESGVRKKGLSSCLLFVGTGNKNLDVEITY